MSVKMAGLVWDTPLPRDEKFLLLAYADHADHYGESIYPAKTTVERMTGYSRRSVQTITAKLVADGLLVEQGISRLGTMTYSLDLDRLESLRDGGGANSARAQKTTPGGRKKQHEGGANSAPKPSVKPSVNPPEVFPKTADLFAEPTIDHPELPPNLRTPELLVAWGEWKEHRRQKRHPLTALATKKQVQEIAAWVVQGGAGLAVAAINHSIKSGYTGLFLPKGAGKSSPVARGPITQENALRMPTKPAGPQTQPQ